MTVVHHRSRCSECAAELVHLAGDPSVPYEEIDPVEGGPRTPREHTEQRCRFYQFLSPPNPALFRPEVPPEDRPRKPRFERWVREDLGSAAAGRVLAELA